MATKTDVKVATILCRGHNSPLLKCVGTVKETDFYNSWSQFEDKKVCYCKTCCETIYKYYKNNGCDNVSALYYTLQKIDIPFIEEVYNQVKGKLTLSSYISTLQRKSINKKIWSDFSATNIDINNFARKVQTVEQERIELEELENIWGMQETEKDYRFLQDTFLKYTQNVEFANPQQEDLYRDLCRDRLLLRKINDKRYDGNESLDSIQKRIEREMSKLKLDNFESSKPKTLSEQTLFNKIAQIEQFKPAELYDTPQKYVDFNGLKKYYKDLVLRPLLNTLCGHRDFNIDIDDVDKYNVK